MPPEVLYADLLSFAGQLTTYPTDLNLLPTAFPFMSTTIWPNLLTSFAIRLRKLEAHQTDDAVYSNSAAKRSENLWFSQPIDEKLLQSAQLYLSASGWWKSASWLTSCAQAQDRHTGRHSRVGASRGARPERGLHAPAAGRFVQPPRPFISITKDRLLLGSDYQKPRAGHSRAGRVYEIEFDAGGDEGVSGWLLVAGRWLLVPGSFLKNMFDIMKNYFRILFFLMLGLGCSENNNPVDPSDQKEYRIVFEGSTNEGVSLFIMNSDGTNQTQLTQGTGWYATWSSDGQKIAFVTKQDGDNEIYVMNSDGSNQKNLTNNSLYDDSPSWSPDGKKITFISVRDRQSEVYSMDSDGSNKTQLTNSQGSDYDPIWSPLGDQIVFQSYGNKSITGIYSISPDGTNQKELAELGLSPVWSPDGKRIAYIYGEEIYLMDADGTNKMRLTNFSSNFRGWLGRPVSWSPDGTRITFFSEENGDLDVYVINSDGSGQLKLTEDLRDEYYSSWSTDGKIITYVTAVGVIGGAEIFTVYTDGTNKRRLTNWNGEVYRPIWSPVPLP
jgi:Tol biopolymer transport system component